MDIDIDGFHHRLVSPANDLSRGTPPRPNPSPSAILNRDITLLLLLIMISIEVNDCIERREGNPKTHEDELKMQIGRMISKPSTLTPPGRAQSTPISSYMRGQ